MRFSAYLNILQLLYLYCSLDSDGKAFDKANECTEG